MFDDDENKYAFFSLNRRQYEIREALAITLLGFEMPADSQYPYLHSEPMKHFSKIADVVLEPLCYFPNMDILFQRTRHGFAAVDSTNTRGIARDDAVVICVSECTVPVVEVLMWIGLFGPAKNRN